jgi:S1-C subfamily serine protease
VSLPIGSIIIPLARIFFFAKFMDFPAAVPKVLLGLGFVSMSTAALVWSSKPAQQAVPPSPTAAHLRAITVRVLSGGQGIGSGTLIGMEGGTYRVITNQHVLPQKIKSLAVQTVDRKIHPVQVVDISQQNNVYGLDLALLEFKTEGEIYVVAKWATALPQVGDEILAAGFPADLQKSLGTEGQQAEPPAIERGVVAYLPARSLADGYQIGHRANVQKGMSGGPAVNLHGELTGINGIHAQPLWEAVETYADGSAVEEPLQSKIPEVSWAIPVQRLGELGVKP